MSEIPLEIAMHAERLYDEGGYESVPTIIAKAIMAERERCAEIADEHAKSRCDNGMTSTEAMRLGAESIASLIRGTS